MFSARCTALRALRTLASLGSARRAIVRPHESDELCGRLPRAFCVREHRLIRGRRERAGIKSKQPIVGLALSGGGVRSATFNLGVLQALATHHALRTVDYLSTVSGGGYIGSFLGRFYTRFINRPEDAIDAIEARLSDAASPEIAWLRRCSGYMAVVGGGDAPVTRAVVLRSFLTVHLILGALLVAMFGVANLFRYGLFPWFVDLSRPWLPNATRLSLPVDLLPSIDPWLFLLAIIILTGFLPLSIAYWLPSVSRPESYEWTRLAAFMICSVTGFVMSLEAGALAPAAGIAVTTLAVFAWVGAAWASIARRMPGATSHPAGRAMVRAQFSKRLATALGLAAIVLGIWVLDEIVFRLYPARMPLGAALGVMCLTFVFLFGPLRWLALWLFTSARAHGWERGPVWRVLTNPFLLPAAAGALLVIQWDLVSHAMFHHGADVGAGFVWTAVSMLISAILGGRAGIVLLNWSSLQLLYAARGSRTYLGASNPYRHATEEGADITSPQAGDDVAFDRYRPDLAGGPLHIINVLVNQSLDKTSGRRTRNRKGENMAVGPCGVSVGRASHATWETGEGRDEIRARLVAVDDGDRPAPFVARRASQEAYKGKSRVQTQFMQLSEWMSISGAALLPGEDADTTLGTSLLSGLTSVRTGFWWDSGIEDGDRRGEPIPSVLQRLGRWIMRRFRTQWRLVDEFTGRFAGPWRRYWYLSDAGHADNLGLYELVRRRVPIIICADATRDVDGGLAALANTMRRVHIDFGAEIEFLSPAALHDLVARSQSWWARPRGLPQSVLDAIGALDDLRFARESNSRRHAAVARVSYNGARSQSVLLYVKATMTGDEPVAVLEYHRQHHGFPQQAVLDQFLDEAQWESYRQLGHHCANPLFRGGLRWLADVLDALPPLHGRANGSV
jgi:hypothetical protein